MILVLKEHTAKRSRYTEEQIAYALRQAETGTPVAEVLRRLSQLKDENRKLGWMVMLTIIARSRRSTAALSAERDIANPASPRLHTRLWGPPDRIG